MYQVSLIICSQISMRVILPPCGDIVSNMKVRENFNSCLIKSNIVIEKKKIKTRIQRFLNSVKKRKKKLLDVLT